jgi:hypothetical protein
VHLRCEETNNARARGRHWRLAIALRPSSHFAALTDFDAVWDALAPREQARVLALLIEHVDRGDDDGGNVSITFRPTRLNALTGRTGARGMTKGITIERRFHVKSGKKGRKGLRDGAAAKIPSGRVPRVAKLMALAIRFDGLIRDGVVADHADLARLGHVTRARLTQIMNLLNLAPDIQETVLFLPATERGRDAVTERDLRPVVAEADWGKQSQTWSVPSPD